MTLERNRWFLAAAIGCFLIFGILLLPSTGRDDTHITYWAAHSLANFGEIVNYSGDRVEQSSSLLLVVALAVLGWIIPLPLTELGWLFSVLFGVGTLLVSARLAAIRPMFSSFSPQRRELLAPAKLGNWSVGQHRRHWGVLVWT